MTRTLEEFAAALRRSPEPQVEAQWRSKWTPRVADRMRRNAPVLTGEYKNSIQANGDEIIVGAEHGLYVEYGTEDTPPFAVAYRSLVELKEDAAGDAAERLVRSI